MRKNLYTLLIMSLLMVIIAPMSIAQAPLFYAAVVDDNVFIYGIAPEPAQVTFNTPNSASFSSSVSSLAWSADGQQLAFVQRTITNNDDGTITISRDIVVVDLGSNVIVPLGFSPSPSFPISFLPDGRMMFTQEGDFPEGSRNARIMNVVTVEPTGDSQLGIETGNFLYGVGCGGGSSFPQDTIYWEEAGGFQGNTMLLANTAIGIVYTLDCTGNGVGLLSPDGSSTVLSYEMRRVKVSPDGNRLLGIAGEDLIIYDLNARTEERIDIRSVPNHVAWGASGTNDVFYSVITDGPMLRIQEEGDLAHMNALLGFALEEIPTYGLNIRKYNLSSRDDSSIYGGFGSAIGRMIASPDGAQLFFSQIPNPNAWVDAVKAGQLGEMGTRNYFNERALLPVELIAIDLATGQSTIIGTNQGQVAFNFSR